LSRTVTVLTRLLTRLVTGHVKRAGIGSRG
jgi:hypothetical protein